MIPVKRLSLETEGQDEWENNQRDALLNDLELDEVEGTAIVDKADAVGRNLAAVLEEGNHPWEGDNEIEGPVGRDIAPVYKLFKFIFISLNVIQYFTFSA